MNTTDLSDNYGDKKHCWVCFATEEEEINENHRNICYYEWVNPCKCKGTTKWVHQTCLQRWIDEKQKGNSSESVTCPQCKFEYIIIYPKAGFFMKALEQADMMLFKICPFIAAGVIVGTIYWTAVTYGAITVMQIMGHEKGLLLMESTDPILLMVSLPAIPLALILGKMIRWEDQVLHYWRKYTPKLLSIITYCLFPTPLPFIQYCSKTSNASMIPHPPHMTSNDSDHPTNSSASESTNYSRLEDSARERNNSLGGTSSSDLLLQQPLASSYDHLSATRILCGALLLPTIATLVGKSIAPSIQSNLQRSLLGGITFIAIKGMIKLYYKQTQFLRMNRRRIMNYCTSDVLPATTLPSWNFNSTSTTSISTLSPSESRHL